MGERHARFGQVPSDEPRLREGARLFNAGRYFESHEVWESLWHDVEGREREFLQGLIQLAAAYHHVSQQNLSGAQYLYQRARAHLEPGRPHHAGVLLDPLLKQVDRAVASVAQGKCPTTSPRVRLRDR